MSMQEVRNTPEYKARVKVLAAQREETLHAALGEFAKCMALLSIPLAVGVLSWVLVVARVGDQSPF